MVSVSTVVQQRDDQVQVTAEDGPHPARPVPSWSWSWSRAFPYLGYSVLQVAQLAVLHRLAPRFFWLDDSQAQFAPMVWWMGRNAQHGVPPLGDPDWGVAGAVTTDMQYGSFDPLHWAVAAVLGRNENLVRMTWEYGATCVLILGLGVLTLLRQHRVPGALAVAGAVGVASSGFFLWYGSFWWPLMWGTAWLPWLWVGLAGRRPVGVLLAGLGTWAVLASGNPYSIPFAAVIVAGQLWERRRAAGSWRATGRSRLFRCQVLSCVGGAVIASPTLVNAVQATGYTTRQSAEAVLGNTGLAVPNLLDTLLGGPTLLGETNSFNGAISLSPSLATFLLAVPVLVLVRWRSAWWSPGLPTAVLLVAAAVLATQLPTVVGPFRFPFRHLVVVQVAVPVLALIGMAAAPASTPLRRRLAAALLGLQFLIAAFRAPLLWPWHVAALVVTGAALVCLLISLGERAVRVRVTAGALVAVLSAGVLFLGEQMMVEVQDRQNATRGFTGAAGQPYRDIGVPGQSGADALGSTIADLRARSILTDQSATVYAWGGFPAVFGADRGWSQGLFPGNANVLAGAAVGFGYLASPHEYLNPVLCLSYVGSLGCADPGRALADVPGTTRPWLDVLASDSVLLRVTAPAQVRAWFDENWDAGPGDANWLRYTRPAGDRLPGRMAQLDGVDVDEQDWTTGLARLGEPQETYRVSTSADSPGTVLLRLPYWPGYRATVDDEPVQVSARAGALVQVVVPAGVSDGRLDVFFDPVGARLLVPSLLGGAIVLLAAWLAAVRLTGRERRAGDRLPHPGAAGAAAVPGGGRPVPAASGGQPGTGSAAGEPAGPATSPIPSVSARPGSPPPPPLPPRGRVGRTLGRAPL